MDAIRTFLARAVPWPSAAQPGFVNIHSQYRDAVTNAPRGLGGQAFTDHEAASRHTFGMLRANTDLYVCMSLQARSEPGRTRAGKPILRASRHTNDAILLRSFWIDVDVKPATFATTVEAKAAFDKWCGIVNLPEPTMIVLTGSGGFHAHWILDEAISRETWLPLAHALQNALKTHMLPVDYGVVIDAARILRIPGTKNYKDPKHVTDAALDQYLTHTYPLSRIEQALAPYKVAYALPVSTAPAKALPFKPNPRQAELGKPMILTAGISAWMPTIDDIAAVCPWIEETLDNEGEEANEPLWFEAMKVCVFVEEGSEVAHDLSRGHADYDEAETDRKYEQATASHGNGRYGWPQCRTINTAGATACLKCPRLKEDKSPLNYAVPVSPAAPPPVAVVYPTPSAPNVVSLLPRLRTAMHSLPNFGFGDLPDGYRYTQYGIVENEIEDPADSTKKVWEQVFPNPLYDLDVHQPTEDGAGHHGVSFYCQTDGLHLRRVHVTLGDLTDIRRFKSSIADFGMASESSPRLRIMALAFRDQLWARKRAAKNSETLGWSAEDGQPEPTGFCYGGLRYTAAGSTPFTPADATIGRKYTPAGSLDAWKQACQLITGQMRPDLNVVVAAAFAAPLLYWTGLSGAALSAYSSASGIGKSHAMRVGQAVWGDPKAAMGTLDDTANYVNARIAMLRHLPFYYDELRQGEDTKKITGLIFAMGQGKSKGRMSASADVKEVHTFSTILIMASNSSIMGSINDEIKTTAAGINRTFSLPIKTVPNAPGLIDSTVAQSMNGALNTNFGHAGAVYAQFLGSNIATVKHAIENNTAVFHKALDANHDERFWVATVAVIVTGARFANRLGLTTIDEQGLVDHLMMQFRENREYRKGSAVDLYLAGNATRYLQDYINVRRENTLITDLVWTQAARPPTTFKPQVINHQNSFDRKLTIRVAKADRLLRVSLSDFGTWLKKDKGVPRDEIIDALKKETGARVRKAAIGSNTSYATAREDVMEFDLTNLTNLFD